MDNNTTVSNQIVVQDNIKDTISLCYFDIDKHSPGNTTGYETAFYDASQARSKNNCFYRRGLGILNNVPQNYRYMLQIQYKLFDQLNVLEPDTKYLYYNGKKEVSDFIYIYKILVDNFVIPERYNLTVSYEKIFKNDLYRVTLIKPKNKITVTDYIRLYNKEVKHYSKIGDIERLNYYITLVNIKEEVISLLQQKLITLDYMALTRFGPIINRILKILVILGEHSEGIGFNEYIDRWAERLLKTNNLNDQFKEI